MVHDVLATTLFDDIFKPLSWGSTLAYEKVLPGQLVFFDVLEKSDERIVLSLPLPGLSESDITITASDHVVVEVKSANSRYVKEGSNWRYKIPAGTDPKNVKALLKNGLLTITMTTAPPRKALTVKIDSE